MKTILVVFSIILISVGIFSLFKAYDHKTFDSNLTILENAAKGPTNPNISVNANKLTVIFNNRNNCLLLAGFVCISIGFLLPIIVMV